MVDVIGNTATITIDTVGASVVDAQNLIDGFSYQNSGQNPTEASRAITIISLTDSGGGTDTSSPSITTTVNVVALNDTPTVDLNSADGTTSNFTTTFTEDGGAVNVTEAGAFISDVDDTSFQYLGINLSNVSDGANELITVGGYTFTYGVNEVVVRTVGGTDFEIDFDGSGFSISKDLGGNMPLADLEALIRGITYENTSQNPTTGNRTIDIEVQDAGGLMSPVATSTITVNALNDAPVITSDGGGATANINVAENTTAVTTVTATDADLDTPTYSITGGADQGLFSIDLNSGVLTFNSAPDFESPADSDADNVYVVEITADDGNGGTDVQTISVTVTNENEAAVVAGTFSGSVNEGNVGDTPVTATGSISISDEDAGDNPAFNDVASTVGDNAYGSFELTAGTWTYTLDQSAVQNLDAGDVVNDTITYTATEGSTQQITVTITGTDDASVITGTVTGAVNEGDIGDAPVTATGSIAISDVDADDSPTFNDVASTAGDNGYGAFALASGTWTYTLDQSAVQDLDAGDVVNDTITYTATDGSTQQITVTITGANDAPTGTGDAYSISEDAILTVDWWDSAWTKRQEVTFNNLAQSETLTDIPVLIVLNSGNIDYTQTKDDGSDLRFFAADGTPLAFEIEQWNEGGESSVWVKAPQITGGSNSDSIWMYYGNAAADPVSDSTGTWDSNFVGVWHLNEEQVGTGNAGVYEDSTSYGNDGVDRVAATGQEGQVTDGQQFGANDWIEIAHDPSLDLKDSMTISFWIKPTSDSGTFNRVVEKGLWGYNNSYYFGGGNGTNDLTFYLNGQEVFDTADGVLTVGATAPRSRPVITRTALCPATPAASRSAMMTRSMTSTASSMKSRSRTSIAAPTGLRRTTRRRRISSVPSSCSSVVKNRHRRSAVCWPTTATSRTTR
jgi:VCBS repeat-containing protein